MLNTICRLPIVRIALTLAATIAGGRQSARADLITNVGVSTTPVSGGLIEYDYTVSDESSSTITASFFFVAVDTTANPFGHDRPNGLGHLLRDGRHGRRVLVAGSLLDIIPELRSACFSFDSPLTPVLSCD